jgi:hypothetical protein
LLVRLARYIAYLQATGKVGLRSWQEFHMSNIMMSDRFNRPGEQARMGFSMTEAEMLKLAASAKGEVFIKLIDGETDEVLEDRHVLNVICSDASILAAMLFKDPTTRDLGANMLAVGTGATGSLLSPDAPDPAQRKLNAELARKPWSQTVFRDAGGNAVAIPTNIVDFTATFDEAEAVGPLNEMGIIAALSSNPLTTNPNPNTYPTRDLTVDLTLYDIQVNYLTFAVISKPSTARLTITWRITF